MIFSYNWLKKYVPDLPAPLELEQGIIFHAFEIESIEEYGGDSLLDIKILPDRAHDCLCHQGIAREVSAIFKLPFSVPELESDLALGRVQNLEIKIEAVTDCRRYVGERAMGVEVGDSPEWLANQLETIGQRSINNIVDATNYVMFDLGQPMHAFDADKVEGAITVRRAKAGEIMTTLDNKELALDESILVIADEKGPLALAGIKGGKRAEVDANTKNLILESANFDPVLVRKTSAKLGIKTDASKRFENDLSPETALPAMVRLVDLLQRIAGGEYLGVVDVYPSPQEEKEIIIDLDYINEKLGLVVPPEELRSILESLEIEVVSQDNKIGLTIPYWRTDLQESINIVEEVGRIYGYDKIEPRLLPEASPLGAVQGLASGSLAEKRFAVFNKIREILAREGFTEVFGYALTNKGEMELANPLASDKAWLRSDLGTWLEEKINFNLEYVLFDTEPVKIFEIGKIFKEGYNEETHLAIGIGYRKKIKGVDTKEEIKKISELLDTQSRGVLRLDLTRLEATDTVAVIEINLDELIDKVQEIDPANLEEFMSLAFNCKKISAYPRIIRDVAVWVPETTTPEFVIDLIKKSVGDLCVLGPVLFDEFAKEGRKSLAFRLVFQSYEKTLSDDEANKEMDKVIEALERESYEVRK
ncbi:MAG TPA: phenylalanine--tRNA ligase subunit beta [Candidatus Paceibacterota bacterium]|nr:phenylalanine--tRNA ligase subunit beta [Candidatus Paceibacterota bacterium]